MADERLFQRSLQEDSSQQLPQASHGACLLGSLIKVY